MTGETAVPARGPLGRGKVTLAARLLFPLGAIVGLVVSAVIVFPTRYPEFYTVLTAYVLPPFGKETVIPGAVAAGFDPLMVAVYIGGLDMTLAWLLAWNWDLVVRVPRVGPWFEATMERGHERLASAPGLDRSAFFGLVFFVFVPFQGSGAVAGIILGRLLGMPPQRAWLAIMIGALSAALLWAFAADGMQALIVLFGLDRVLQVTLLVISSLALAWLITRKVTQ